MTKRWNMRTGEEKILLDIGQPRGQKGSGRVEEPQLHTLHPGKVNAAHRLLGERRDGVWAWR